MDIIGFIIVIIIAVIGNIYKYHFVHDVWLCSFFVVFFPRYC